MPHFVLSPPNHSPDRIIDARFRSFEDRVARGAPADAGSSPIAVAKLKCRPFALERRERASASRDRMAQVLKPCRRICCATRGARAHPARRSRLCRSPKRRTRVTWPAVIFATEVDPDRRLGRGLDAARLYARPAPERPRTRNVAWGRWWR